MRHTLRNSIFISIIFASFVTGVSFADNVKIKTSFPSPYGSYGTASASNDSRFATRSGNVQLATGNGNTRVLVGSANPEPATQRTLSVLGPNSAQHTAAFIHSSGYGVELGGTSNLPTGASVQAIQPGGSATLLTLNGAGGNVGVGTTNPLYTLHVVGVIGISDSGNTGDLKLSYDSGDYYANYAP